MFGTYEQTHYNTAPFWLKAGALSQNGYIYHVFVCMFWVWVWVLVFLVFVLIYLQTDSEEFVCYLLCLDVYFLYYFHQYGMVNWFLYNCTLYY